MRSPAASVVLPAERREHSNESGDAEPGFERNGGAHRLAANRFVDGHQLKAVAAAVMTTLGSASAGQPLLPKPRCAVEELLIDIAGRLRPQRLANQALQQAAMRALAPVQLRIRLPSRQQTCGCVRAT